MGVILVVFLVLFGVVAARLAELQTVNRDRYVTFGQTQRIASQTLPAGRGAIFDRNGHDLALSVPQKTVVANPRLVPDPVAAGRRLAPVLGVDAEVLTERLSEGGYFVYLSRAVSDDVAERVEALDLDGVEFIEEPRRFTPSGTLARSLLGGVNIDNIGYSGLEQQYDDVLVGDPGELIVERDINGRTIPAGEQQLEPPVRGDDLVLTIDRAMQYETERALAEQVDATGAEGGMAIVSRPETGEILAMANIDAGEAGAARSGGNNAALTTVFEPGSVNKVITVAASLEEGLVTPGTELTVPDSLTLGGYPFSDHDAHPPTTWSVTDILTVSSNIGTIKLALELGPERIDEYLHAFGFGAPTTLDFPNESGGIMLPPEEWSGSSIGAIPLGQGISVTAMQMLSAYNVFANGGVYTAPRLVAATVDADGVEHPADPPASRRVLSERTAGQVSAMLANVVASGTGEQAAIPGYTVAGKTGTARKPQPEGGYYDAAGNFHYVATFAGFVPAEDPELSIIVVLDDPSSSYYAGTVVAPVFAELARYALRRFEVPPAAERDDLDVPESTPGAEAGEDNELPADLLGGAGEGSEDDDDREDDDGAASEGDVADGVESTADPGDT
ncbi:penicillin-binding protein [soil metagenome]